MTSIIITDLTRFAHGNPSVCVAGIEVKSGKCIRPMPYLKFEECVELDLFPGSILTGDLTPFPNLKFPHTEDCRAIGLKLTGVCTSDEFRKVLEESCATGVENGFGVSIPNGERVIREDSAPASSIITLRVDSKHIRIADGYKPGSIRLDFRDSVGREWYNFPITDLGFFDYAQRHQKSDAMKALNDKISKQSEVFLRIGLARLWKKPPDGPEGFWMQANGIYTFPDKIRYVRSYVE